MNKQLRALKQRKSQQLAAMRVITDKATAENRDLTAEEQTEFDKLKAQVSVTNAAIEREELLVQEEQQLGVLEIPGARQISGGTPQLETDPKRGFRTIGEFARSVRLAGNNLENPNDERLRIGAAAPTTFGSEGVGADGGFLVPPEFSQQVFTHALTEDSLLPMTDSTEVTGNSMVFPKDETTPWGTDGVRAYWQAEAAAANATKPKLGLATLRLYKLMALVPITDELLEDARALASYLPGKAGDSIRWKTNEAILFGDGNGTPLGAFKSAAVVTVGAEGGQATQTLLPMNIGKMIARLPPGSFGRAMWMINNDVIPALYTLTLGNYPIYMPAGGSVGGIQQSPYGMLSGRPVQVSQHAKSFSTQGDVLLVDAFYVRSITKGGIRSDMSLHLYFDADAAAFRFTFRVDAQPKISNPIAPANGSATLSPFVQLGAR